MGDFFSSKQVNPIAAQPIMGGQTQQQILQQILGMAGFGSGPNSMLASVFTNPFQTPQNQGGSPSGSFGGMMTSGGPGSPAGGGSPFGSLFSQQPGGTNGGGGAFGPMFNMAEGGGAATPVSALPAWQAMTQAQNRNISAGQADLASLFNSQGGRNSTDFGNAATDYELQARLGQNALLGQMQLPALLQSQNISAGAGMQLPGSMLGAGLAQTGLLSGIANMYPPMYQPGYQPSMFSQLAGGLGGLFGGLGSMASGGLFGGGLGAGTGGSGGGGAPMGFGYGGIA